MEFISNGLRYSTEHAKLICVEKGEYVSALEGRNIIGEKIKPHIDRYKNKIYKTYKGNYFKLSYWQTFNIGADIIVYEHLPIVSMEAISREDAIKVWFNENTQKLVSEKEAFDKIEIA